jgi:hypothetical protein
MDDIIASQPLEREAIQYRRVHFRPGARLISQALVLHSNCSTRVLWHEMHLGSFGYLDMG